MKNLIISTSLTLLFLVTQAQQDPNAKEILDRVSAKTKAYVTIQADFELVIKNRREDKQTQSKGIIKIKGTKYYMESMGTKVYFDGKTLWSYMQDLNEATVNEPDPKDGDFIENPAKIFDFYNRDFKYRLIGETKLDDILMYEIDLFPKSLDQPYSRYKVFIKKDGDELYMVNAISKDGVDYIAYIRNAKYNVDIKDELFKFDPANHKGLEVVDMRF